MRDLVWVVADPHSPEQRAKQDRIESAEAEKSKEVPDQWLADAISSIDGLRADAHERTRSFDTRLSGLVGLMSVVVAVAGPLSATASTSASTLHPPELVQRLGLVALGLHLLAAVQLLRTIWAAICGLRLQDVDSLVIADELPHAGETESAHARRRLLARVKSLQSLVRATDNKGTWLLVAHRSALNAFAYLLLAWLVHGARQLA